MHCSHELVQEGQHPMRRVIMCPIKIAISGHTLFSGKKSGPTSPEKSGRNKGVEEIRYCGRNPAPVGRWFIPLQSHYNSSFVGILVTNSCRTIRMKLQQVPSWPVGYLKPARTKVVLYKYVFIAVGQNYSLPNW